MVQTVPMVVPELLAAAEVKVPTVAEGVRVDMAEGEDMEAEVELAAEGNRNPQPNTVAEGARADREAEEGTVAVDLVVANMVAEAMAWKRQSPQSASKPRCRNL